MGRRMLDIFLFVQNEENQRVSVPAPKEILDRLCKPEDSGKHVKETHLCSGANELLNFFHRCVSVFFHKECFKLEINKENTQELL